MDDTAQDQVQSSVQNGGQAQQAPSDQTGVGSIQKEQGPTVYQEPDEKIEQQQGEEEYLKPSEIETLPKEVQEAGVEVTTKHDVASFVKPTGIEPAKESTPVITSPSGNIKLPPEKEVLKILKTTSVKDSKHWMAFLIEKIYEQLRVITGKK